MEDDLSPKLSARKSTISNHGKSTSELGMASSLGIKPRSFNCSVEINFNELTFESQISEGGYGIIYKGKWRETVVAIKMFKLES